MRIARVLVIAVAAATLAGCTAQGTPSPGFAAGTLRWQEPGKTVGLTVRRGSNDQKLTVTLGDLAQQ